MTLLVALIFTIAATGAAWFFAPKPDNYVLTRVAVAWVAVAVSTFLIYDNLYSLALTAVLLGLLAPLSPLRRVYFYIGVFVAVPLAFKANVPFPGLNYLIALDYAKVTTLVVLLPIFLVKVAEKTPPVLRAVDRFLLVFVLLTSVILFRELPITSVMRFFVDQMLLIYVPYIAISRTLKTREDIDGALKVLFFAVLVVAFIGVISTARNWNYYSLVHDGADYKMFSDYRNGLLRVQSTLASALIAVVMGLATILSFHLKRMNQLNGRIALLCAAIFTFIAFASGARGGWISFIVVIAGYIVMTRFGALWRRVFAYSLLLAGIAGTYRLITDTSFISGELDNIVYRAEIMRASAGQIADHPLFGENSFRESWRFAHLVQGEGIVDIVNLYLEVALAFGLVGLALWLGAFFGMIRTVFAQSLKMRTWIDQGLMSDVDQRRSALLLASIFGFMVMIFTVSGVSYTYHFGYLILAVAVAHGRYVAIMVSQGIPESQTQPISAPSISDDTSAAAPSAHSMAYGARFVRRH